MKRKSLLGILLLVLLASVGLSGELQSRPSAIQSDPAIIAAFDTLQEYIKSISDEVLTKGQRNSLIKKLANAKKSYLRDLPCTATNILRAYINQTQALRKGDRVQIAEDLYNKGHILSRNILTSLSEEETCPGHPVVGKKPKVDIVASNNEYLITSVAPAEPELSSVDVDGERFTQVQVHGVPTPISEPGLPAVPIWRALIAVPMGADISITATPHVGKTVYLNLYPIQPHEIDQLGNQPFEKNEAAYTADRWYPEEVCAAIPLGYLRDVQIAEIACATGRYNPVSDQYTMFESVDWEVTYTGGSDAFITAASLNPFDNTLEVLEGNIINSDIITNFPAPPPACSIDGEELLILTHPDFLDAANTLADWKQEKGIVTHVFEVTEVTDEVTCEDIDDFIEDHYYEACIRPSYVLLFGDAEFIPPCYVPAETSGSGPSGKLAGSETIGSDYPYAVVTTPGAFYDYLMPDLGVGRISVDTLVQANAVVEKIIQYESNPPTTHSFYENAAFASLFQCCKSVVQDGLAQRTFIESSEFARNLLEGNGYTVERIYTEIVDSFYTYSGGTFYTSPDGETWSLESSTDSMLKGVAYGNNTFVVVGGYGNILSSPNGKTWMVQDSGTTSYLTAVTYANNTFFALAGSTILTSPNGTVWTIQPGAPHLIEDVTYGNNTFVAVGGDGTILTSPDGTNWTAQVSGTDVWLYGVTYGNNTFVAVGRDGTILTSPDGTTWSDPASGTNDEYLTDVSYGNNIFVAVGYDGALLTSWNGTTWTARDSGTTKHLNGVNYDNDMFFAQGGYDMLLTSSDGVTWMVRHLGIHNFIHDVTYGKDTFVAIGGRDTTPRAYFDGTPLPAEIGPASDFSWDGTTQDIIDAFNDGRFLIMHRDHGGPDQWVHPYLSAEQVYEGLYNGDLLPVVFSVNCASGLFDNETADGALETSYGAVYFSEALLRNPLGGAVGVLGATRNSPSWPNTYLMKGLFDAVWPDAIPDFGGDTPKRRLSDILNHGKLYMLSQLGAYADLLAEFQVSDPYAEAIDATLDEYALWHAFGDPTLEIWTSNPTPHWLPLGQPAIFYYGEDFMQVRYPEAGVTLTLFQGNLPIARSVTNEEGVATFYYVNNPQSGLPIVFSASKENYVSVQLTPLLQVDQVNDVPAGTSWGCGPEVGELYQSFTPAASHLAGVDLRLRAGGLFPSEGINTTMNIRSGTVDGDLLGTVTSFVSGPQLPGNQPTVHFEVSPAVLLTPEETYVIEWITPGDSILTWMAAEGNPYPGGTAFSCSGSDMPNMDFIFTTYAHALQPVGYHIIASPYTDEEEKSWIEIELLDEQHEPVPSAPYEVTLPDGTLKEGSLDGNGRAKIGVTGSGICHIFFPGEDTEVWIKV